MADGSLDDAPVFTDIAAFDGRPWRGVVDLIVGGFPCQDLSVAGRQEGINGKRSGLWFEYARIIREVEPGWVLVENVPPVLAFPAGGAVLGELAQSGLDAQWISIRAADVGAPHRRERVFVLAYRAVGGLGMLRESSRRNGFIGGATRDWPTPVKQDGNSSARHSTSTGVMHPGTTLTDSIRNWPTPDANVMNDGESSESWRARQMELKRKGINGNGAGVPLAIAAQELKSA